MNSNLPDVALAGVIASLIAAFVSFAGLVISKEQKTSEFRQAWVDALRQDAAAVAAKFLGYVDARAFGAPTGSESVASNLTAFRTAATTVRLRLNVSESASTAAFEALGQMDVLIATGDLVQTKAAQATATFVSSLQPILKAEWERVKRGEFWFRTTKWAFLTLAATAAAYLAATLFLAIRVGG